MTPEDSQLQGLLCARAVCMEKRRDADRRGALRARLHALDTELTDIVEAIQSLCARRGLALPAGVPPPTLWPPPQARSQAGELR